MPADSEFASRRAGAENLVDDHRAWVRMSEFGGLSGRRGARGGSKRREVGVRDLALDEFPILVMRSDVHRPISVAILFEFGEL
jgi:hypothetical protein